MREFLHKLFLFALIQASIGVVLVLAFEPDPDSYMAATIDKNAWLREAPSPRIVFIGGSGLAFGLDSERVAEALPYAPVNMGLHGGLGLPFMLAEARAGLRPGDVAVLAIEYELFGRDGTSDALLEALEHRPASAQLLSSAYLAPVLESAVSYFGHVVRKGIHRLQGKPPRVGTLPYARRAFNEWGDVVAHRGMEAREWSPEPQLANGVPEQHLDETILALNRFYAFCSERGIPVLFTFSPIPHRVFESLEPEIQTIAERLARDASFPLMFEPEELLLPEDDFFDSAYHLTARGTERRMALLVPALQERLAHTGESATGRAEAALPR